MSAAEVIEIVKAIYAEVQAKTISQVTFEMFQNRVEDLADRMQKWTMENKDYTDDTLR